MLISRNVALGKPRKLTPWRKVAIGTWRSAGDPSVYGMIEADVGPAMAYLEKLKRETDVKLTLTHFFGRACAEVFRRHPEINCVLRLGRLYPRKTVDIFFQVANDRKGNDLSGLTIREADTKSVTAIAREMQGLVSDIREKGDPGFKRMKGLMGLLPGFLAWPIVNLTGFLMYTCNLWSSLLGMPKDPFGSAMVTNIGSLGLDLAYAPLVPYSRTPLLLAIGAVREQPVVRDGKITKALIAKLCVTFDHRLVDGVHASCMVDTLTSILADPAKELRI
ncbi:MAG TPA: 2-oxo acid dehydrogenase subunit E2 [Bdellovibrionales bacterium]|nr:2-oxo acid dehydrogenase subunit E2 [Bdellovibrionales bacterium]